MRQIQRLLLSLTLIFAASCAVLPEAELVAYSDSFASAKTAGDLILDEVSNVIPKEQANQAGPNCDVNPATGYRPCFKVSLALGADGSGAQESPDIRVRRLALAMIATYNQMLVDIAEGRSAKVINGRIDKVSALATSVVGLVPGSASLVAGLPVEAIKGIVTKFETIRSSAAGARSVVEAETDIRRLLQFMINDTPALYGLYITQYEGQLTVAKSALRRAQISNNASEIARLSQLVNNLQSRSASANKARAFEQALTTYVKVLDQTDKAIVELVQAITLSELNPVDRATVFVRRATETRILVEQLESDLRKLRFAGP
jgi:hypothetical protein